MSVKAAIESFVVSEEYIRIQSAKSKLNPGELIFRPLKSTWQIASRCSVTDAEALKEIDPSYMTSANCIVSDFLCPEFKLFCESIRHPVIFHRKLWEFGFITHHLSKKGKLQPGRRGLGFGVGTEPLPSLFAKYGCHILATDAPPGVASEGWTTSNEYSTSVETVFRSDILARELFDDRVSFSFSDMNNIGNEFSDFDFCWSACCFEHLGDLDKGFAFVEASVENTLKVGGVACHTSEFNLSSNDKTIESGDTVLFRRKDVEQLIDRLERRGHTCEILPFCSGQSFLDHLVDLPGGTAELHLKLRLQDFVTTSFGIVVTRGR